MAKQGRSKVKYRPYPKYPFPRLRSLKARLNPFRSLESAAWTRGGAWTSLIVVFVGARTLKRMLPRKPEVLATDKLRPGQSILITTAPREGRKARR